MKILVVCQYYYPEVFKVTDVCESLVERGHSVTVLTGLPNYPTGIVPDEYINGTHNDEIINGVHVIRCYERGRKKGAVNLALNYAIFYFSAMKAVKKFSAEFDLVYSYQLSPIFMALPARWYKKKWKKPMFLYCSDLWPESIKMYVKNETNPIFKWVNSISRKVYRSADRIATQSDSFIEYLVKTHEIAKEKITYIPNFADEEYLKRDFSPKDNNESDFVFLGNVGIAQNLDKVIEAFSKASSDRKMKLHIVGGGACLDELKSLTVKLNVTDKVIFYGQRPIEEMTDFYQIADACVVSLKADNATGLTLPAKVQGYMAAGKPVIGMITGSAKTVIDDAKCGICVEADDIDGLAKAFVDYSEQPEAYNLYSQNARDYFIKNFRREIHINRIEEELIRLLSD